MLVREDTEGPCVWRDRRTLPQDIQKGNPLTPPNPGAPRRALSQARPQRVKQAEVEVKVERNKLLHPQPWPEPKPFRKRAEFFSILLGLLVGFKRRHLQIEHAAALGAA